ncbi:hypothetical protein KUTeg_001695 [Tegillarca granosa]|uniref:PAS domain-containing protein n=1 Tax=Tegillarca granosa TaxID=220873 RepID=A0ABQ9FS73_TEGGR|nr:hypothetical protein KUTeg_001695 [Tegillarca granosa]
MVIIVSPGDLSVVDVSANIKDILGYPLDSWKGRDLLNFVNKKDTSAVVSKLTNDFGDFDDLAENKESDDFSVSKFDTRSEQISNKKTLYFRMRHFKGLDSGFSLTKADSYTAFQVTVDVKFKEQVESRLYSPPLSLLQDKDEIISFDKKKKIKFLQLNCVPLLSAYDDPSISSNRTFHTRHTLLSSYSYIHPNAIQLTGFLPHEMVGTSIFDYYHPEDMEQLHNIYKQVLSSKGTPFKSPPVKFRIKNGDYIVVETEWTSFVNPWSHHLEFIIGQHSVIKGPEKTNIFDDTGKPDSSDLPDGALKYQQMIRDLLIKPISSRVKKVLGNTLSKTEDTRKDNKNSKSQTPAGDGQDLTDKEITDITEKQRPYEISVSPDDSEQSSPGLMCENECSMAYEQLNYTNNIKKFLLSQPKSLSSESDKKESWPSSTEEEEDVSVSDFDVDISVPKPPSFGSSTKVLVSEQEPREDIAGSPAHQTEETLEDLSLREAPVVSFVTPPAVIQDRPLECDHHSQVSLTQQALWKHTKLQEKLFIQQAKDDRNMVVIKRNDKTSVVSDASPQRVKRIHSPDRASNERQIRANKSSKIKKRVVLDPPFPITTTDMKLTNINQNYSQYQAEVQAANLAAGINIPPDQTSTTNTSVSTSAQNMVTSTAGAGGETFTTNSTSMNNLQWPYYQQSAGVKLIPQVVSGFYQPGTGIFHTVNTISLSVPEFSTANSGYNPNATQATYTDTTTYSNADCHRVAHKRPFSSDNSSSADDTSSSLLYLLESGSQSHSSASLSHDENGQEKAARIPKERKRCLEPPWLMQVNWTKDVQMRYVMPKKKLSRILMSDKDELCRMKQSDVVIHQMHQLQHEVDNLDNPAIFDEESDFLFPVDEEDMCHMLSGDAVKECCDCDDFDHDHGINSFRLAANFKKKMTLDNRKMKKKMDSSSSSSKTESSENNDDTSLNLLKCQESPVSCASESPVPSTSDCAVSCASDSSHHDLSLPKSSDLESESVEMESVCSKASSDLTPSDQRSNEEAGSSMKESDMSSKDSDNGNRDSSESDMEIKRESSSSKTDEKVPYEKFFVPLKLYFKATDKSVAPWLMDTEMNEKIAMEYTIQQKKLDEVLKSDENAMENLQQSPLVVNQFETLLNDIQNDTDANAAKTSQSQSNACAEPNEKKSDKPLGDQTGMECDSDLFGQLFNKLFTSFPGMSDVDDEHIKAEPSFEDILD